MSMDTQFGNLGLCFYGLDGDIYGEEGYGYGQCDLGNVRGCKSSTDPITDTAPFDPDCNNSKEC